MTLHEAELREALQPLAGDPRDDAARVMARLPASRANPWRPVLWTAAGAAAGLLVGLFAARSETPVDDPVDQPAEALVAAAPPPQVRIVRGSVRVDDPDGPRPIEPRTEIAYDRVLHTKYGAAEIALDASTLLRLGDYAALRLYGPREVGLELGRVWVSAAPADTAMQVWLEAGGRVEIENGTVDVRRDDEGLAVAVTRGRATFFGAGDRYDLAAGQCFVRAPDARGAVEPCDPLAVTEWVTPFLADPVNAAERTRRLEKLIRLLADPTLRARADRQIRMLGSGACPGLLLAMDLVGKPAYQKCLALLVADLANHDYSMAVVQMLRSKDADVRAAMFRSLRRLIGSAPREANTEEFWRTAPPLVRDRFIEEWWMLMRPK